jgi:hypothetical protein
MTRHRLLPCLLLVFLAGVMCSVICPERATAAAAEHPEAGYCSECISTDFVEGGKFSEESISHQEAGFIRDNFFVAVWPWSSTDYTVSEAFSALHSPPIFLLHCVLRA